MSWFRKTPPPQIVHTYDPEPLGVRVVTTDVGGLKVEYRVSRRPALTGRQYEVRRDGVRVAVCDSPAHADKIIREGAAKDRQLLVDDSRLKELKKRKKAQEQSKK